VKEGVCYVIRPGIMSAAEEEKRAFESHLAKTTDLLDLKRRCSHQSKEFIEACGRHEAEAAYL